MPSCGYKVYVMSHTFFNTGGWNKLSSIASFILAQLVGLLMETTINENRFVRATKQQMAHLKPQSITFQLQTDFSDLGLHSITFHRSLESIDRIDFCDNHFASESYKSLGWSFANIAVTGHDCCFACKKEEIQKWARDRELTLNHPNFTMSYLLTWRWLLVLSHPLVTLGIHTDCRICSESHSLI